MLGLERKLDVLYSFLKSHLQSKAIVFMSSCKQVRYVYETFCRFRPGVPLMALYGKQKQARRTAIFADFGRKEAAFLFCTDIAARGLDIAGVDWVVQLDCPESAETYIHRVGRTGRAGKKGIAISLVAPAEAHRARAIEERQKAPLNWQPLSELKAQAGAPLQPPMVTLCIGAGRKDKLRPGDILGALTGDAGIPGTQVGKIAIFDFQAFVAVERGAAKQALNRLNAGKIKGRSLKVRQL